MKGIEFQIYWMEKEAHSLHELGIEVSEDQVTTRPITFYNIDMIQPTEQYDKPACIICSAGQEYISPLPYSEVKRILEKH